MGELGGSLLHRRVGEHPVRVPIPLRVEPGSQVLELHFFELPLLQDTGIPRIVVEYLPVSILLGGPQIIPAAPETVISQVHREQPVKVRQPLFGEKV
jgi:hypothetical protein